MINPLWGRGSPDPLVVEDYYRKVILFYPYPKEKDNCKSIWDKERNNFHCHITIQRKWFTCTEGTGSWHRCRGGGPGTLRTNKDKDVSNICRYMCVKKYDLNDNMIWGVNLPKGEAHSCSLQHGKQNVTAKQKNHFNILVDMYFFNI